MSLDTKQRDKVRVQVDLSIDEATQLELLDIITI